jgi:uncharacterized membrane protein
MKEWLVVATEWASLVIDWMALILIAVGTVEAFFGAMRLAVGGAHNNHERRLVWLNYARWLVAGLTFQLAADIIETSVAPTWDDIGRLAAIAIVRTFLNYFLERDLSETREKDRESASG